MSLRYFPPAARGRHATARPQTQPQTQTVTTVTETVSVTPLPSQSRTDLLAPESAWGWSEVRDYVVAQIEDRFGAFPRDARKEASIFKRWTEKYGTDAPRIAKYAFEVADGMWRGAPISVNRFCKASDAFFSDQILAALTD